MSINGKHLCEHLSPCGSIRLFIIICFILLSDAVAAIIGTVIKSELVEEEIKIQPSAVDTKDSNANEIKHKEPSPNDPTMAPDTNSTLKNQKAESVRNSFYLNLS